MCEFEAFYEMVKKWTVNDYRTQKIKSEVVIDMLISDFIEEMVSYGIDEKGSTVKLIAKEFPIERISQAENEHQYASVDYLLSDMSSNVYLTELKTTNDSFDGVQLLNMLGVCNRGIHALRNPLEYVVLEYGIQKHFNERGTKKYLYTLKNMMNCYEFGQMSLACFADSSRDGDKQNALAKKIIDGVFGKLESTKPEIKILYISLNYISIEEKAEKAKIPYNIQGTNVILKPIIISEIISDNNFIKTLPLEKQSAWERTRNILGELVKLYSEWYN